MLKQFTLCSIMLVSATAAFSQTPTFTDSAAVYFREIKSAAQENADFWRQNLHGPILLVHPDTRRVFANFHDTAGVLKPEGDVYTGILPNEVNIANTSLPWNGRRWSMLMLPLPENKQDRLNLLAHELFHQAQPELGFEAANPANNHLDQKEGRISLRLELEALKKAMVATSASEIKEHLRNALTFRNNRHAKYPGADSTENLLELNEGISEYTGIVFSGRNRMEMQKHFTASIDRFVASPTYVRSFAYETTPVYGYLLRDTKPYWHREVDMQTDLTQYFHDAFQLSLPEDLKKVFSEIAGDYNGKTIMAEEAAREERIQKQLADYKRKFVQEPHLDIPFESMNISFDYRKIMPLEDFGTVYPQIRVTDNWGILTVENGALIDPNWQRITVSNPTEISETTVRGDGWILELNQNYTVKKNETNKNYHVTNINK